MTGSDPLQPESAAESGRDEVHEKPTVMAPSGSAVVAGDLSIVGMPPSASQYLGQTLGEYRLIELIGAGGGGTVFRALHERMDRMVAVKVIAPQAMSDAEAVRRFQREVRAAAKLMHPNIVTAFDAGEQDGIHYLVMELVDGLSLTKIVEQQGPLPVVTALKYLLQVAHALRYAHQRHVIHRDIKPSNILVTSDKTVKVLDMGLARLHEFNPAEDLDHITRVGVVMGTVGYMSPEQAMNAVDVDHRTDIYSLGCTMHFLLTGRPIYSGNFMQTLMAHMSEPVPRLSDRGPSVTPLLEATFRKMVAKKPENRQSSMAELITELEWCLGELTDASQPVQLTPSESRLERMLRDTVQTQEPVSTATQPALIAALDVGTSRSSAAAVDLEHRLVTIPSEQQQAATPSLVSYDDDRLIIGYRCAESYQGAAHTIATDVRRALGEVEYPRPLSGQSFPPEVLLACLYRRLLDNARNRVGEVRRVLLTTPALFNDRLRRTMLCAAGLAGAEALGLVDESTAIALLWAFRNQLPSTDQRRILVYRLGGGSFEASIYEVRGRQITMRGTRGDERLGGTDWDQRLTEAVAWEFHRKHGINPLENVAAKLRLRRICEQAKRALSDFDRVPIHSVFFGHPLKATTSRQQLANLTHDLAERTAALTSELLESLGLSWSDIDHLVPVGGMVRLPMIRQLLERLSKRSLEPITWGEDAVARGAALYAAQAIPWLHNERPPWQVDLVAALDLAMVGFDAQGHRRAAVLIPRDTPLPKTLRRTFRTRREGQTTLVAQLVQGDARDVDACDAIGSYTLQLPPGLPAQTPIEVEFSLTADGLVQVSATSGQLPVSITVQRPNEMTGEDFQSWREWLEPVFLCGDTDTGG